MSAKDPKYLVERPDPTWNELADSRFGRSMDGYKEMCAFSAAVKLGLFDILCEPLTAAQTAERLGTDSPLLEPFLKVLAGTELLKEEDGRYVCGKAATTFFISSSPYYQKERMNTIMTRLRRWDDLADSIMNVWKEEKHELDHVPWITGVGESALSGDIQETVRAFRDIEDISSCRTLLDLGGGHGLYAIAFQTAFPGMHCTVFDQPQITPVTRANARAYGTDIGVLTGDYYKDDIQGTYDAVFASYNHACSDPDLVPKIASLMNPGGYLLIRHSLPFEGRPIDFIDWNNFPRKEGMKRRPFDEYIRAAEENGLTPCGSKPLNGRSELMMFRKGN